MKISTLGLEFGLDALNKTGGMKQVKMEGALAALETFYYGFNNRSIEVVKAVWFDDGFVQLNNPVGGIVRGTDAVMEIYDRIFNGKVRVWVRLTDILAYVADKSVVFAGTEVGEFSFNGETMPLKFRTTRCFGYIESEGKWLQLHHHGSIDDPEVLRKYQVQVQSR